MYHINRVFRCTTLHTGLGFFPSKIPLRLGIISKTPARSLVQYQKVSNNYKINEVPPSEDPKNDYKLSSTKKKLVLISGGIMILGTCVLAYQFLPPSREKFEREQIMRGKSDVKIPPDSSTIPKEVPYLLIGGGTASFSAFRAIKSNDPTAKVLLVNKEAYYPYMRPPLSKEMWYQQDVEIQKLRFKQWNGSERSLFFEPDEFFISWDKLENEPKGGIACIQGWTVIKVDPEKKIAVLDDGSEIKYNKCLLATGISPKNLPVFENAPENVKEKVTVFRNIDDFKFLYELMKKQIKSITVVGGSFLGSELTCAFSRNNESGIKVTQVFPEKGNLAKVLPTYLSSWATEKMREQGIEIIPSVDIQNASLSNNGKQIEITLSNGKKVCTDHVVVAVGSESNVDLAATSGLEVDSELGGFLVNSELAARTDLYAAGDCSCFYDPQLGRRRVEHHDHAVVSGRLAGENMAGDHQAYRHQSMFWSDLGPDIGFEAVGIIDSSLPTVAIYAKPPEDSSEDDKKSDANPDSQINTSLPKQGEDYSKGVIFYLKDDLIVGIVMWNVFSRLTLARQILRERKKFNDLNEVAKLFAIHEDV